MQVLTTIDTWDGAQPLARVVVMGIAAVGWLMPESRASETPALDPLGMLTSSVGLGAMTYGLVQAGQNGWSSAGALLTIVVGVALLAVFALWERRLSARRPGRSLVDLALFRSRSFTWGTILAGFAVGVALADRLVRLIGAKPTVATGFAILASGLAAGATMTLSSGGAFTASWTAGCGIGLGPVMAAASSAALGELSAERAGVGSALMRSVQKVGVPLSAAILGSVLNGTYRGDLPLAAIGVVLASAFLPGRVGRRVLVESAGSGLDVPG
ncbi:MAG: hypothetical protein HYR62_01240 [Actinobacteria bacterium]|nr:hypothetical protein [Actinomycetota bacterium]MBI3688800.1 hypothetical protein [Actinomycetota bacterium]